MTRFDDIGVGFFRGVLGGSLVCFSIAREGVLIFSRRIRARLLEGNHSGDILRDNGVFSLARNGLGVFDRRIRRQ